jgi:hypothetical protein
VVHVYGTRVHYLPSLGGTDLEAHAAVPPPKSGSAPRPPPPGVAPDDEPTAIILLGTRVHYMGYSVQWL